MKVLGESKKGHKILMVTEFEFDIVTTALAEYLEVCMWSETGPKRELNTVINRLRKALHSFDELESDIKKLKARETKEREG